MKISEIYHNHGISRYLLQKFKVDILRYFEIYFAPFFNKIIKIAFKGTEETDYSK